MSKAYSVRLHMGNVSLQLRVELEGRYEYPEDAAAEMATEWANANLDRFEAENGYSLVEGEVP